MRPRNRARPNVAKESSHKPRSQSKPGYFTTVKLTGTLRTLPRLVHWPAHAEALPFSVHTWAPAYFGETIITSVPDACFIPLYYYVGKKERENQQPGAGVKSLG